MLTTQGSYAELAKKPRSDYKTITLLVDGRRQGPPEGKKYIDYVESKRSGDGYFAVFYTLDEGGGIKLAPIEAYGDWDFSKREFPYHSACLRFDIIGGAFIKLRDKYVLEGPVTKPLDQPTLNKLKFKVAMEMISSRRGYRFVNSSRAPISAAAAIEDLFTAKQADAEQPADKIAADAEPTQSGATAAEATGKPPVDLRKDIKVGIVAPSEPAKRSKYRDDNQLE